MGWQPQSARCRQAEEVAGTDSGSDETDIGWIQPQQHRDPPRVRGLVDLVLPILQRARPLTSATIARATLAEKMFGPSPAAAGREIQPPRTVGRGGQATVS